MSGRDTLAANLSRMPPLAQQVLLTTASSKLLQNALQPHLLQQMPSCTRLVADAWQYKRGLLPHMVGSTNKHNTLTHTVTHTTRRHTHFSGAHCTCREPYSTRRAHTNAAFTPGHPHTQQTLSTHAISYSPLFTEGLRNCNRCFCPPQAPTPCCDRAKQPYTQRQTVQIS